MWLTGRYASHSDLTRQKTEERISIKNLEHSMWKYKSALYLPQYQKIKGNVSSRSKRRDKNCTWRYSKGLRNQNKEHLVNICESNILETQVS